MPFAPDDEGPVPGAVHVALSRRCQAIVVTPRAQNPTGAALAGRARRNFAKYLRRFPQVVLVENDYAGPVAGAPLHTLYDPSREYWIAVRSLSKFLGPDVRVAVLAGDDVTIARVPRSPSPGCPGRKSDPSATGACALGGPGQWATDRQGRRGLHRASYDGHRRAGRARNRGARPVWIQRLGASSRRNKRSSRVGCEGLGRGGGRAVPNSGRAGIRITISTLSIEDAERLAGDLARLRGSVSGGIA